MDRTGTTEAAQTLLERNIRALERTSPTMAAAVRASAPRSDIEFFQTDDGVPSARLGDGPDAVGLASRRRPLQEAQRLADKVKVADVGCVAVTGFGLGHHVRELARRMRRTGVIVVYEPDARLLRAAFERIDFSQTLEDSNVVVLPDADDTGAMSAALRGAEGIVAMGVTLLEHPPSRARLGPGAGRFYERFTRLIGAVRTQVLTSMVQVRATIRNLLMNLDRYALGDGIADLAGAAPGRPAVVVSAGPSLERNAALLAKPGVRDRVVIIAVQTAFKTLLEHGVKPHFVTALDYHEISRRFYEGISARDAEGVTLVAEPKANPAILDAWPGSTRCSADGLLDLLLGERLARDMGRLQSGATVAHLSYYLARFLGCDPVVLIGQDLAFTDGQYYSAGAAIHGVWACELNPFRTLEMFEWERIARARGNLRRATDVLGRPVYTDEQMATYAVQFEREFLADAQRGLRTIDATEGGIAKAHTTATTLALALGEHAGAGAETVSLPEPRAEDAPTLDKVIRRVEDVRRDVLRVSELSRKAEGLLGQMLEHQKDQQRVNTLIERVNKVRDEVEKVEPAYSLVHHLNQTGTFKRIRADRRIETNPDLDGMQRQRLQIERDLMNVRWLADAADELASLLGDARACLEGAPKQTRDPAAREEEIEGGPGHEHGAPKRAQTALAVAIVDPARSGLGTPRPLDRPFLLGKNPLRLMLERLARCERLGGVALITPEPETVSRLVGGDIPDLRVEITTCERAALDARAPGIASARLWADACWRGGLGGLTCYDEALCAPLTHEALKRYNADAALIVGADWALVDPGLCDALIERHFENPKAQPVAFCQAPPGLAGCVIGSQTAERLAAAWDSGGALASLGGVLGFVPAAPVGDPIASAACLHVDHETRDAAIRFIPDSEPRRELLSAALGRMEEALLDAPARAVAEAVSETALTTWSPAPLQVTLELCTGRRTSGKRAHWDRGAAGNVERRPLDPALASRLFKQIGEARTDCALTLAGSGDPLLHPDLFDIIAEARDAGIAGIHVRTDLLCDQATLDRLLACGVDVISVDLMATSAPTYAHLMGVDRYEQARRNTEYLIEQRARMHAAASGDGSGGHDGAGAIPVPWIVPRMTRCDAVYEQVEEFYETWTRKAGAAVIDPLPVRIPGERIEPLPKPLVAAARDLRRRMLILSDGTVPLSDRDVHGQNPIADVSKNSIDQAWRRLLRVRRESLEDRRSGQSRAALLHAQLWMGY